MTLSVPRGIFGLFLLVSSMQASDRPDRPALTHAQYVDLLQSYENQIHQLAAAPQNAPALRDSVQTSLTVQSSRGNVEVNTEFIREEMNRFLTVEPKAKSQILSALSERLRAMRAEADLYEQPSRADEATRKRLEQILATREFNRVRGPSSLELLKERIGAWILKQLRRISPTVPDLQSAGHIFVWTMIVLASAVVGIWLYRLSRDSIAGGKREILPFLPSSRSWHEWLSQAREHAALGQWRDAIHLGFWAAVSRLESEGVWPPDMARTPREYLRAIPSSSPSQEPFSALTGKFEASWYGARPTTETDFAQFVANLERLGCR